MPWWMLSALMVNWRSDVNTPLRLNGRTIRSASTPSIESRSTMPFGWATIQPKRTPLATRSARASWPVAQARLTASARIACRSAVISRASSSTSPDPVRAIVCRSLENEGSVLSNCALSKPSETKTLATSSPDPPAIGSLWQPKQEFESGPLVRLKGGLTPLLRLVGMIACVAFGRPAPSTVVNFALNSSRPRSTRAGSADGPAAATASKSTCEPNTRSSQLPPEAALAARTADAASNAKDSAENRMAKGVRPPDPAGAADPAPDSAVSPPPLAPNRAFRLPSQAFQFIARLAAAALESDERQREAEFRPAAWIGFSPDSPVVGFDDRTGDREADP